MDTIILLGHGSPAEKGNQAMDEIALRLSDRMPDVDVRCSFLRFGEPNLSKAVDEAVKKGASRIIVHPYFLGKGGHIVSEIPQLVEEARHKHLGVEFILTEPLGFHPGLVDAVYDRIKEATGRNSETLTTKNHLSEERFLHGFIQVYTGKGKGKTTASLGLALRAAGAGLRVFVLQFLKNGSYSEVQSLKHLSENITVQYFGSGRFVEGKPCEDDHVSAQRGLAEAERAISSGEYDLVILDEANVAVSYGLIALDDLIKLVDSKPESLEMVITGRNAADRLIEKADLVTEMREVKHYYHKGVKARKGIEK